MAQPSALSILCIVVAIIAFTLKSHQDSPVKYALMKTLMEFTVLGLVLILYLQTIRQVNEDDRFQLAEVSQVIFGNCVLGDNLNVIITKV